MEMATTTTANCENGAQLLARLETKPPLDTLEVNLLPGVTGKHVVELCGEEDSGKTQVMLHLVCRCILPQWWQQCQLGGLNVGVVYVDSELDFPVLRLTTMLEATLSHAARLHHLEPLTQPQMEEFIKACLSNLYVVRCYSSCQLIVTLYSLESLLHTKPSICLLLLDSCCAFYWKDMCVGVLDGHQDKMVRALQNLIDTYSVLVIASRPAIVDSRKGKQADSADSCLGAARKEDGHHDTFHDCMCKTWQNMVTHRCMFGGADHVHPCQTALHSYSVVVLKKNSAEEHRTIFSISEKGVNFVA